MKWRINDYSKSYEGVSGLFDINLWIPTERGIEITATDAKCWAHLFITLKLSLIPDDSGSGVKITEKDKYKTMPWPASEWEKFKNTVKTKAAMWDLKFWLVLKDDRQKSRAYDNIKQYFAIYKDLPANPSGKRTRIVFPRVIACRFKLEISDYAGYASHKRIEVAYIVDAVTEKPISGPLAQYISRSNDSYYDYGDLEDEGNGFNTIVHEIGHAIGLPHIGVVTNHKPCTGWFEKDWLQGNNREACYEGPLADDIMGSGSLFHWQDALPWRFALQELTDVPLDYYIVQTMPFSPPVSQGETIEEGTPEWRHFFD